MNELIISIVVLIGIIVAYYEGKRSAYYEIVSDLLSSITIVDKPEEIVKSDDK